MLNQRGIKHFTVNVPEAAEPGTAMAGEAGAIGRVAAPRLGIRRRFLHSPFLPNSKFMTSQA